MLKLIFLQLLHGTKVLQDWNITSVDGSWALWHMLENVADGTDGRYERDLWTLDIYSPPWLTTRVQGGIVKLTVDNVLEFGKYFWFILQGGGEESGVTKSCTLYTVRCWIMFVLLILFYHWNWPLQTVVWKTKALCLAWFYLFPWTRNWLLSLYGLKYDHIWNFSISLIASNFPVVPGNQL